MTAELLLRMACLACGVAAVLGGLHSGRPRPYNINGDLRVRGVLVIVLGLALVGAGATGIAIGPVT